MPKFWFITICCHTVVTANVEITTQFIAVTSTQLVIWTRLASVMTLYAATAKAQTTHQKIAEATKRPAVVV